MEVLGHRTAPPVEGLFRASASGTKRTPVEPGYQGNLPLNVEKEDALRAVLAGDAPRPVEAVFTDDASLVPVSMRVTVWYLPMAVRFGHFCKSFDACGADGP
jgi:hypothetical protein